MAKDKPEIGIQSEAASLPGCEGDLDFGKIEDINDLESYPVVKRYRALLNKKEPFPIAFLEPYDVEYRKKEYPWDLIFTLPGRGEVTVLDPDTAAAIEASEVTESGNGFIESIAHGVILIDVKNCGGFINNDEYRARYREALAARQRELLAKANNVSQIDANGNPIKDSPL